MASRGPADRSGEAGRGARAGSGRRSGLARKNEWAGSVGLVATLCEPNR